MVLLDVIEPIFGEWQTIVVAAVILFVVYYFWISPYQALKACYHTGPTPLPFIGHLHDLIRHKGKFHLQLDEYYKKYGNVFVMSMFTSKPCFVISDPEMIKDIFVKEFESFCDRPNVVKQPEPLASMLTIAEKDKWKRIRNTLTPAFSALKMKQMIPLMNTCCDNLIKKLSGVADKEQSVNISKYQQSLTMDVIVSAAFGFEVDSQSNPDEPILSAVRQATQQGGFRRILLTIISIFPFGMKIMELLPSLWMANLKPLLNISEEIVQLKRGGQGNSPRKDMLDLMLAAADDTTVPESKKLSDNEIIAQSMVFLFAGHETTSTVLSFACYHLAVSPEIQEKLQQEIDSVWSDDSQMLSYETIHQLPYLDMVISETLRLYPPGFLIIRNCTKDCILKGVKIPKDIAVMIPVYSIHRDPSIYADPDKFDPERFAKEESRNPYSFMPFGNGPHNCIGLRFAMIEMKLVLARILKKYRFEVAPDTKQPPEVIVKSTLTCLDIHLRVTSRAKTA